MYTLHFNPSLEKEDNKISCIKQHVLLTRQLTSKTVRPKKLKLCAMNSPRSQGFTKKYFLNILHLWAKKQFPQNTQNSLLEALFRSYHIESRQAGCTTNCKPYTLKKAKYLLSVLVFILYCSLAFFKLFFLIFDFG